MASRKKKYKGIKYMGDDPYSWAIFLAEDVKGLRSPISEYTKATPIYAGLCMSEKKHYIKQLELADEKKKRDVEHTIP
jgi:hypothetical protein